jgi:hypothetical protein
MDAKIFVCGPCSADKHGACRNLPSQGRHCECACRQRFVDWGHWGIGFWGGDPNLPTSTRAVCRLDFAVGVQGPMDGTVGSPTRERYRAACKAWVERGEIPEGAVCHVGQRWLYAEGNA